MFGDHIQFNILGSCGWLCGVFASLMNLLTCEAAHISPVKAKPITSAHMSVRRAIGNTETLHLEGLALLLCNAFQPLFLKKKKKKEKVLQEKTHAKLC